MWTWCRNLEKPTVESDFIDDNETIQPERSAAVSELRREKMRRARDMYQAGWKLVSIAAKIGIPPGTVRRWKCVCHWAEELEKAGQKNASICNAPNREEISSALDTLDALPLTDRQNLFVIDYAKSCNATRSYQKIYGCSYAFAVVRGPVLAGKAEIQNTVRSVRKSLLSQTLLTTDDIVQKFIEIAFADITDFLEFGPEEVLPAKTANVVRLRPSSEIDGTLLDEISYGKNGVKVKLCNRMKTLK